MARGSGASDRDHRRRGAPVDHRGQQRGRRREKTKGKLADQYRELVGEYENLAQQTRDLQAAMQADLAELRKKVASIEHMMREVA